MNGQKIIDIDESWIGGTELMAIGLQENILPIAPHLAKWQWSQLPGKINLREDGKNIIWVHLGEFEGHLSWLSNPKIAYIIFNSYYQYQRFTEYFPDIDQNKCRVIKNAIKPIEPNAKYKQGDKLKLVFHSEPYRGLDVLLEALKLIEDKDLELHVLGDLHTTTIDWKIDFQNKIKDMCKNDNRVFLHGRVSNQEVRKQLSESHIFAYPSTWRETSCIALIEALSAGLYCITNSFTVLPETGIGLTQIYPFNWNLNRHAEILAEKIKEGILSIKSGKFDQSSQIARANDYYSWENVSKEWIAFANEISMNY